MDINKMYIQIKEQQWDFQRHVYVHLINNNDVIGSACIRFNEWVQIEAVYIYPEYRGKGYFKQLFEAVLEYVKDEETVFLCVRTDNFISKNYKRYGFKFHRRVQTNNIKFKWLKKRI
jgi:GNAT superfamily N-acetyltransferase